MERRHTRASRLSAQAAPQGPQGRRILRVLVVDDDQDTRDVLKLILCPEEGFEMVGCGDVERCLAYLRAAMRGEASPFDVLLLDLMLPAGHSGTEILEAGGSGAADAPRLPPVVVCTALSDAALTPYLPLLDRYGVRLVHKPFGIDMILAELRAAVGA